ncbi:MAG: SoxR reducing system RseC family protein [Treponema sp.]|jgi:positive regulator of sigma E activity|nr:SoxR reducing system RseC family protein [Treponema sp.]
MRGRVHSVRGKTVFIIPENTACFGCMKGGCGKRIVLVGAENRDGFSLAPGRIVETDVNRGALLAQALFALLPPAAGFAAGFFITGLLPAAGIAREAGGIFLMLSGGFACFLFRRRFPSREKPVVSRVLA